MKISNGQGSALRAVLIRREYKHLKAATITLKRNSSEIQPIAPQEPVESGFQVPEGRKLQHFLTSPSLAAGDLALIVFT